MIRFSVAFFCLALSLLTGCFGSLKVKNAIENGDIRLGMPKTEVENILGKGELFKMEALETDEVLEVRIYTDWFVAFGTTAIRKSWVAFVNNTVSGFGYAGGAMIRSVKCRTTFTGNTAHTSCF